MTLLVGQLLFVLPAFLVRDPSLRSGWHC